MEQEKSSFMEQEKLPNATAVLVLGILSIVTCCCFGIFGVIFGIIALILANKDMKLYKQNPGLYTNYNNLNTGRIIAIIGLVLSALFLVRIIYSIIFDPEGFQMGLDEFNRAYQEGRNHRQ